MTDTKDGARVDPRAAVPASDRLTAAVMDLAALVTVGYWADYFTKGRVRSSGDPAYVAFENAFPLADGYLALCLAAGARALRRQHPAAVPWGIAAGSAMVYLAAMDTLFNLENGKYADRSPEMAVEAVINAATWTLGPWLIRRSWRSRTRLAPP
jgi:hypothetical protein